VATKADLLDKEWLGATLSERMLSAFEARGVDACGEWGEYHTVVFTSPRMSGPLKLREVAPLMHDGYWMLDLEPVE
jgi:diphthine-ammonia ligase